MMDDADPLALRPLNNSDVKKVKEKTAISQAMALKASNNIQRMIQVLQRMAEKNYRRACQLFCCSFQTLLCERVTCCPGQYHQPKEDRTRQAALQNPPSTILIVNISNSTLIDCVIGNDTYPAAVAESQPLMQEPELRMHNQTRCSCSCGHQGAAQTSASIPPPPPPPPPPLYSPLPSDEPPRINIQSSHLNCVIIGDNNYMYAEQTYSAETEEPQE
ncbi:uncharacterized protein LOC131976643 [Centropristis striata]|uniref:uncharacterized protein LOC131976643 n=1 Tax=Centropristis striata TaxID=184440 RepID=UPI0027E1B34B|nr:uncharacterized protein LOC131976643 [Centropristis striata]